jgi:hypothetical protein
MTLLLHVLGSVRGAALQCKSRVLEEAPAQSEWIPGEIRGCVLAKKKRERLKSSSCRGGKSRL